MTRVCYDTALNEDAIWDSLDLPDSSIIPPDEEFPRLFKITVTVKEIECQTQPK